MERHGTSCEHLPHFSLILPFFALYASTSATFSFVTALNPRIYFTLLTPLQLLPLTLLVLPLHFTIVILWSACSSYEKTQNIPFSPLIPSSSFIPLSCPTLLNITTTLLSLIPPSQSSGFAFSFQYFPSSHFSAET